MIAGAALIIAGAAAAGIISGGQKNVSEDYVEHVNNNVTKIINETLNKNSKLIEMSNKARQSIELNMDGARLHKCKFTSGMNIGISENIYSITDITTDAKQSSDLMEKIADAFKKSVKESSKGTAFTPQQNKDITKYIDDSFTNTDVINRVKSELSVKIQINNDIWQKGVLNFKDGVCDETTFDFNEFVKLDTIAKSITSNIMKSEQISKIIKDISSQIDIDKSQSNTGIDFTLIAIIGMILFALVFILPELIPIVFGAGFFGVAKSAVGGGKGSGTPAKKVVSRKSAVGAQTTKDLKKMQKKLKQAFGF